MFSKLLKYDFINTRRYGLPLLFSILGTGILGAGFSFLFNRSLSAGRIPSALDVFLTVSSAFLFMLCIFALFALCALMMVFMMVHFYKNLVTDEGYLTFTLPVSPANILCSKLFTAFVWNILAWIAAFCAFVILFIPFMDIFSMDWDAILSSLRQLASTLNLLDLQSWAALVLTLINLVFSCISTILMIYTAIILGSVIARKHKILAAMGLIFAISAVKSIVSSVVLFFPLLLSSGTLLEMSVDGYMNLTNTLSILISAIFAISCFFLSKYLLEKKLNLE